MNRIASIPMAGVFSLFPILVTVFITAWIINFVHEWAGLDSGIGRLLVSMGLNVSASPPAAYVAGIAILSATILVLGLIVESSWRSLLGQIFNGLLRRIPLVSNVYDLSKRFVSMVDRSSDEDMKNMSPVWYFFVSKGGADILALMPSPQPVWLTGEQSGH